MDCKCVNKTCESNNYKMSSAIENVVCVIRLSSAVPGGVCFFRHIFQTFKHICSLNLHNLWYLIYLVNHPNTDSGFVNCRPSRHARTILVKHIFLRRLLLSNYLLPQQTILFGSCLIKMILHELSFNTNCYETSLGNDFKRLSDYLARCIQIPERVS